MLTVVPGFGQKVFEGTIIYQLHSSDKNEDAQLEVHFGKNAIKMKFTEKDNAEKEGVIVRLDSGKKYVLNTEEKTFRVKRLAQLVKHELNASNKKIAGYNTRPVDLTGNALLGMMGGLFRGAGTVFFVSDSLFYPIPEQYGSNIELLMIHQGRIVLGAEIKTGSVSLFDDEDDENMEDDKMEITASAISIKWENFNEHEFAIPADFVKYTDTYATDSSAAPDSLMAMPDSIATTEPVKWKPKTKEVKKKVTPTKQPVKPKTKVTNSKDGSIRKPD